MAPYTTLDSADYSVDTTTSVSEALGGGPSRNFLPPPKDDDLVEPVAIVGLSFRLPRGASSTESFWELLMEQRTTATEFPTDRLSASAMYHPDPNRRGTVSVLPNISHFCISMILPVLTSIDTVSWRAFC